MASGPPAAAVSAWPWSVLRGASPTRRTGWRLAQSAECRSFLCRRWHWLTPYLPGFAAAIGNFDRAGVAACGIEGGDQLQPVLGRHDEHQEPAAARSRNFSGQRAVRERHVAELIDALIGNARRGQLFRRLGVGKEACHTVYVTGEQSVLH